MSSRTPGTAAYNGAQTTDGGREGRGAGRCAGQTRRRSARRRLLAECIATRRLQRLPPAPRTMTDFSSRPPPPAGLGHAPAGPADHCAVAGLARPSRCAGAPGLGQCAEPEPACARARTHARTLTCFRSRGARGQGVLEKVTGVVSPAPRAQGLSLLAQRPTSERRGFGVTSSIS